ncbi:hypothetical protein [Spiroplasma endosymbiont of Crioceris asparagi]|uniref:hypothetical protein n=1 Tax=Spiroplasma endosymbiont of Crioceris asparagi TaxID=3066286 RepID=UPI0030CD3E8C
METEFLKLLEKLTKNNPEFKLRNPNDQENHFLKQFEQNDHLRTGFIYKFVNTKGMMYMSLPLAQLLAEINQSGVDQQFLVYKALLIK